MSLNPSYHIQTRRGNNVRIGPISIITLITVICLAVLALFRLTNACLVGGLVLGFTILLCLQ